MRYEGVQMNLIRVLGIVILCIASLAAVLPIAAILFLGPGWELTFHFLGESGLSLFFTSSVLARPWFGTDHCLWLGSMAAREGLATKRLIFATTADMDFQVSISRTDRALKSLGVNLGH
jgi:hypothetical protein